MYLISFRSRTSTIGFNRILDKFNYKSQIINTPRSISSSCSLSIKVDMDYPTLKTILIKSNIHDYMGIFTFYNGSFVRIF